MATNMFEELAIKGAWLIRNIKYPDERGSFHEWFRENEITLRTGQNFVVAQGNISTSKAGVVRGIHYSLAPMGQSKLVTCISGKVWDVIVDLRQDSPTFKHWIGVDLNSETGDAVYLSGGLGHGFIALKDNSILCYLVSTTYSPKNEYEINPFDLELAIDWPQFNYLLSDKDKNAPLLSQLIVENKLPKLN